MKTIAVSTRAKTLNNLLKRARRNGVILKTADGERYILTSLGSWQGFEVGASEDFGEEVKRTVRNKKLMKFLAKRRTNGQRIPLAKVKEELGLG